MLFFNILSTLSTFNRSSFSSLILLLTLLLNITESTLSTEKLSSETRKKILNFKWLMMRICWSSIYTVLGSATVRAHFWLLSTGYEPGIPPSYLKTLVSHSLISLSPSFDSVFGRFNSLPECFLERPLLSLLDILSFDIFIVSIAHLSASLNNSLFR